MKKAAIYVRVSTAEQKKFGMSVDSQIDALREYCQKNDYTEFDIYNDAGRTATKYKNRSELKRMMADCRSGAVDIVLFTRLDRFFRDVEDYYECTKLMNYVPWIAIWEPDYRTDTATGKFNVNLRLSLAQHEAEQDSERIKSVKAYQRAQGHYMGGTAPVGYIKQNKRLAYDENTRENVRLFFEDYINDISIADCVDRSAARGLSFTRQQAYRILRMPYYYDSDVPYVSQDERAKIEYRLSNVKVRQCSHPNRVHIFQGICFCGYCGHQLSCSTRSRESQIRGKYEQKVIACHHNKSQYYDSCSERPAINEDVLEKILLEQIEDAIRKHNANLNASENQKNIKSVQNQINNLNVRLDRLKLLFEMAEIDLDEFKEKRDKIRSDISSLELSISSLDTPVPELPPGWRIQYDSLDESGKRDFWHGILKKVILYKNRDVQVEL